MAVDLAKLSLWLATLAKDHPFTFLDHALRHGDSLVGLSKKQILAFHWDLSLAFVSQRVARKRRFGCTFLPPRFSLTAVKRLLWLHRNKDHHARRYTWHRASIYLRERRNNLQRDP